MKFDKNIPLPSRKYNIPSINDLREMKVGESFFIENCPHAAAVSGTLSYKISKLMFKVTTRKEGTGVRVWRIA